MWRELKDLRKIKDLFFEARKLVPKLISERKRD